MALFRHCFLIIPFGSLKFVCIGSGLLVIARHLLLGVVIVVCACFGFPHRQ